MQRQLVPIRKISPDVHGIPFSPDMLGWIAFHRDYNGTLSCGAIVKVGGRVYVDPPKFLEWMATNPRISPPMKAAKKASSPVPATAPLPANRRGKVKPVLPKKQKPVRRNVAAESATA